jgi:hypothetical protein
MQMPTLSDAHQVLARLEGNWRGDERLQPSPWDPAGGTAQATIENRVALGGFAVVQDYRQTRNDRADFLGHGVFSWDEARAEYVLHWWDSMGMPPNEFRGPFDGGVFTLICVSPQMRSRAMFDVSQPGRYRFRMDISMDGRSWQNFMEGDYTRG